MRPRLSAEVLSKRIENSIQNRHRICKNMSIKLPIGKPIYANKIKRCTKCDVYYPIPVLRCPCCHHLLRCNKRAKTRIGKNQPPDDTHRRI